MAAKGIEQRHLFLLHQRVLLSVTDCGPGLTTMAPTNLLKLDRVQSEAMPVVVGTIKESRPPPLQTGQKVERVKAYFSAVEKRPQPTLRRRERQKEMQTWTGQSLGCVKQRTQY